MKKVLFKFLDVIFEHVRRIEHVSRICKKIRLREKSCAVARENK